MKIRLAVAEDGEQLLRLNEAFNGKDETSLQRVREMLERSDLETVVVAEAEGALAGFACVQMKHSFCYRLPAAEITEVYVRPEFRRRGLARGMIAFAEAHCQKAGVRKVELLTGQDNQVAQALYRGLGYQAEDELLMKKYL